MTNGTAPESYSYDADGERVVRTAGGVTTVFFEGVWEQTTTGARKLYYTFNGQVVAMRDSTTNTVTYLHGDHLGSVSAATNDTGTAATTQEFDPWGRVRAGGIGATSLNYTGQRLDATGLLYYHARYYNPVLARFVSADSVVPGNASGGMDGVALKGLTVDFHEPGFAAQIGSENSQPFWFQMSGRQRQRAGDPWGPQNPQALNRYSYVQNNPLHYTDPSGHVLADEGGGYYEGYRTATGEPGKTYVDRQGRTIYVDPDTHVMYRIDQDGNKQRLYEIWVWDDSPQSECFPRNICHKYVYEDDPEFDDFKSSVDILHPDPVSAVIGGGGSKEDGLGSIALALYYRLFPPGHTPVDYFRDMSDQGRIRPRTYGPPESPDSTPYTDGTHY